MDFERSNNHVYRIKNPNIKGKLTLVKWFFLGKFTFPQFPVKHLLLQTIRHFCILRNTVILQGITKSGLQSMEFIDQA